MTFKELPLLSIVTPNYNDSNTIGKLIASIADQDYPNIEHIIVDDGSTDDSKKVLEDLEKKYPKLKVLYLNNSGACAARNEGAKIAKGKYISFLPADAILYPGMARIWVETLERYPEYDFLYGGYKFVDESGHEVFSYLSDEFDPYFLKVTNYIDGSFPLKKTLFDKMGGWDTQIKSLQDWDFWLNAVFNYNAKGFYSRQVFFETTIPHPGGLSDDSHRNWLERTTQIKNKYGFKISKICVTGPGANFHAKNIAKILDADYLPVPSFKPHKYEMIYVIGFFGEVSRCFFNTNAMRVVHWIGSDILQLSQAEEKIKQATIEWIDNNIDINLCEMEATQKELANLGIKARIVPFPPYKLYEPLPLPEKFSVAVYLPYLNKDFYYQDFIEGIAKEMPDIHFFFFGDPMHMGTKENVTGEGVCNKSEMEELVKKSSCILRLTPHDGLPLSVVEWITAGRHAITTIDIPYSNVIKFKIWDKKEPPTQKELDKLVKHNRDKAICLIRNLIGTKPDLAGSEYYRKICNQEVFKDTIYSFLHLDIKKWWDTISDLWPNMESNQETTDDIAQIIKEVKLLKAKDCIDLGCGTGRWADLLPIEDYTGIDFSEKLIKIAEEKHPDKTFLTGDILDIKPGEKFDLAFSFATLLHIKPEDIGKYAEKIKTIAKYAILVEPVRETQQVGEARIIHPAIKKIQKETDFIFNVRYTFIHDYMKHFNVMKVIPLSNNRNMFIVEL